MELDKEMSQLISYESELAKDNDAMVNLYERTQFDGEDILEALEKKRANPPPPYPVHYKEDKTKGNVYKLANICTQHSTGDIIHKRKSRRSFQNKPVLSYMLSEILHYTAGRVPGRSGDHGVRVHPSAGSLYPVDTYLVCKGDDYIEDGWHLYSVKSHALISVADKVGTSFLQATFGLKRPPHHFLVWVADLNRQFGKYGANAYRFACLEAGHMAQNTSLVLEHFGLGGFCIGGFDNKRISHTLNLGELEWPIYAMAFGEPACDS